MKYNSTTQAFFRLLSIGSGIKISREPDRILTSSNGQEYFFVEITDYNNLSHYVIEAYGPDAIELYHETVKLKQ